jgi:hypothetical protein
MTLLSPKDVRNLKQGKLGSFLKSSYCLREAFLINRHDKLYMAKVINFPKPRVSGEIRPKQMNLNYEIFTRLITEATALIEELHTIGMRVSEPLERYHHYFLNNKVYQTNMVKLTTSKIFPDSANLLGKVDGPEGDYLSI